MKNWMIIKNNIIENIIKADDDFIAQSGFEAYEYQGVGDIGDGYVHGVGLFPKQISEQDVLNALPEISSYKLRRQLTKMGIRQAIEDAIAASDQDIKDGYEYGISYRYNHPLVQMFIQQFGMSNQDVITLFNEASQIV